jgi:hypothetical protein
MNAVGTEAVCRVCGHRIRLCANGLWGHVDALRHPRHYAAPRRGSEG